MSPTQQAALGIVHATKGDYVTIIQSGWSELRGYWTIFADTQGEVLIKCTTKGDHLVNGTVGDQVKLGYTETAQGDGDLSNAANFIIATEVVPQVRPTETVQPITSSPQDGNHHNIVTQDQSVQYNLLFFNGVPKELMAAIKQSLTGSSKQAPVVTVSANAAMQAAVRKAVPKTTSKLASKKNR
jgi:hypothetical protein